MYAQVKWLQQIAFKIKIIFKERIITVLHDSDPKKNDYIWTIN